jgi:preprotein translocase subunit YajC
MTSALIPLQSALGSGASQLFMIVALIAIFYFFMIRPQTKRQKEVRKFRENLLKGDRVITAGGIYGRIRDIKETTIVLEVATNVCITIDKAMIYPSASDAQNDASNATAEQK